MKMRTGFWAMIAMLALVTACGPAEDPARETREREAPPQRAGSTVPAVAALVAHRVADYDAWKTVFDEHMQARKDAGCLGHHVNRGADDPNMVYVYCPATDARKLKAFLDSADLAEAMKKAGVEGQPTITLLKPMSEDFIPDQLLPGIIVFHPVEGYAAWRAAYDRFDTHRQQNGIIGHAVDQELGNPNQVIVYHQANDMDTLRAFVASTELKETMQRAGVIGEPDIRFVQVADFAEY